MAHKRRQKDINILEHQDLSQEGLKNWIGEVFFNSSTLGFHFPPDVFDLWITEVLTSYKETVSAVQKKMILVKVLHTKEVIEAGLDIMTRSGEVNWDQYQVCTVCLLHDIGRFKQSLLGSYSDKETDFDHALEGSLIIKNADLKEMELLGVNKVSVVESVAMHSGIIYEGTNDYARLTRDADKLALLRYMPYLIDKDRFPQGGVNPKVLADFDNGQMIRNDDRNSYGDVLLSWFCWESDFNFDATREAFLEEGIKDWILGELKQEGVTL